MQPTSEAAGRQSGPPRSALVNIYTFILERSAGSIPIRAFSAPYTRFSAISPPLGLVSSRGLRAAIALSREGLARVRVHPRRGRRAALARWQGRVSAVSQTRPSHSPISLQRPVCWGPPRVPRSRSFFFWSQSLVLDRCGLGAAATAACCCCCPQHQY